MRSFTQSLPVMAYNWYPVADISEGDNTTFQWFRASRNVACGNVSPVTCQKVTVPDHEKPGS